MSRTEDYLDGLLNSVDGTKNKDIESGMPARDMTFAEKMDEEPALRASSRDAEQDFLDAFEREFLSGEDTDEFIRQFERELDREDNTLVGKTASEDDFFAKLDDMGNETETNPIEVQATQQEADEMDFMVDTLGEFPGDDMGSSMGFEEFDDGFPVNTEFDNSLPGLDDVLASEEEKSEDLSEDQDLMDLLQSEGDFSGIGEDFSTEEERTVISDDMLGELDGFTLEEIPIDDSMILEDAKESGEDEKKKGETTGFLKKISQALFGDEDEEEEEKATPQAKESKKAPSPSIEDLSDENLMLLQELEGTETETQEQEEEIPETEEEAKARKKREKKEKKEQKKAEKAEKKELAKKEKAEKKAKKEKEKEKKPKKPKEPDNTPPLPKKPVILCFVMAGSFLALVILGTNLFGYSSSMSEAEKQYVLGNYEEAYQKVSGMDIKDKDFETYEKYRVMGTVSGEYSAYQTFMEAGLYDMALDSLVRAVGRCEKYQEQAELYGCTGELSKLRQQAAGALGSFGITETRALELYGIEERSDYSSQIQNILEEAGFSVD